MTRALRDSNFEAHGRGRVRPRISTDFLTSGRRMFSRLCQNGSHAYEASLRGSSGRLNRISSAGGAHCAQTPALQGPVARLSEVLDQFEVGANTEALVQSPIGSLVVQDRALVRRDLETVSVIRDCMISRSCFVPGSIT